MNKNIVEREINLLDMLWTVCLKWRQILLAAVIFAVLAGGLSYLKSSQMAKEASEPAEEIDLEDIGLEDDSKKNVDVYLEYKQMYADQIIYNDSAPLMQLDANGFYRDVITFYVDNHYAVEYPLMTKTNNINAMLETYKAELRTNEFTTKLNELVGNDECTMPYGTELVDCANKYGHLNEMTSGVGVLMISVYGNNEQTCKELASLVMETIQAGKGNVTEKFGEHEIFLIEENCSYISDPDLLRYQQENINKLSTYATNIDNMKNKLTDIELSYVDAYEKEEMLESGELKEEAVEVPVVSISKKLVVLGFVGGAAVVFCVAVFTYLFNGRLRLEDNFEMMYGVKLLGNVILKDNKKKKWFGFVDKFFTKMRHLNRHYFEADEAISMVAAGIKIGAKRMNASKVYVTGATLGKEEKKVIEKLQKELNKADVSLIAGKPILYDAEALEKSAEVGFVVLLEEAGVSLYNEVAEEIEVCEHQGMNVLGAIVVA